MKQPIKDQLLTQIQICKTMKTSEVIRWGTAHYSNRAERTMRELASLGYVRRMTDSEKEFSFGPIREDVWILNQKPVEKQLEFTS